MGGRARGRVTANARQDRARCVTLGALSGLHWLSDGQGPGADPGPPSAFSVHPAFFLAGSTGTARMAGGRTSRRACPRWRSLRNRNGRPDEEVSAPKMIAGLKQLASRGQTRGIKVIGGTLTPFENETFLPRAWSVVRSRPSDPDAADLRLRRPPPPERPGLPQEGRRHRSVSLRIGVHRAVGLMPA